MRGGAALILRMAKRRRSRAAFGRCALSGQVSCPTLGVSAVGFKASEISGKTSVLAEVYSSLGDSGKKEMSAAYPHINFDDLLAQADIERDDFLDDEPIAGLKPTSYTLAQSGSLWRKIFEFAAWGAFFVIMFFGAALAFLDSRSVFEAFVWLAITTSAAFFVLSAAKVLLQVAKDASYAADDADEVLEMMKGRR